MKELHQIEAALIDVDGSCRDVNFEGATWDGVAEFVSSLEQSFEERSAHDADGNLIDEPHCETAIVSARRGGSVHLRYRAGSTVVTALQTFICREDDDSPFVELTFFPQDVLRTEHLERDFILWMNEIQMRLQARRYYCRYENASWCFGDTGPRSGVFLVSDRPTPTK